jgi:hypothetical protein
MDEEAQPSTFCPWQPKETPMIDHAGRIWRRHAIVLPPDTAIWLGR